jgi:hypothetical protein
VQIIIGFLRQFRQDWAHSAWYGRRLPKTIQKKI